MTRLANIEKAGYFPLPESVTDLILTYLTAPHRGRVLDPCAGEGSALITLADRLGLAPYGVELHQGRAEKAAQAIQHWQVRQLQQSRSALLPRQNDKRLLHDSYLNLVTPRASYNLLYLNPPYDHDPEEGRLEYQWLKHCRPHLQPGGVLIWVVPQHLLRFTQATRYIAGWYERVHLFRFPDPEYAQFRQVVLFGVLRPRSIPPDPELVEKLTLMGSGLTPLPPLVPASTPLYTLPPLQVADPAFHFRSWLIEPAEALAESRQQGVRTTSAWREHLDAAAIHTPLRPLTPLKIGHMSSVIAAGHLNNQLLNQGEEKLLIKGRSYKTMRHTSFDEPLPGGKTRTTYMSTEQVMTDITTVNGQGELVAYKGSDLERFLQQWITPLTDLVAQGYPPVYTFDLNGYGPVLNSLSRDRVIPGLNGQTGLLPAQKHAAAAALTRLKTAHDCLIVGEMGTGKTSLGIGIAAGMAARRTIILCPPHLVDKWQREARIVWPGVRAMALETISDVDAFFRAQPDLAPLRQSSGQVLIGVVKQTTARAASGWEHAYNLIGPAAHSYGSQRITERRRCWGEALAPIRLLDRPVEERQWRGRVLSERQILALQGRGIRCPVCGKQQMNRDVPLSVGELKAATRRCNYQGCRSPLYQFRRHRSPNQRQGSFLLYCERETRIHAQLRQGEPSADPTPTPWLDGPAADSYHHTPDKLFGYGRVPLSAYIKHRAKGRLDLLLVDEAHQYKGIDSDQGYAMHHLAQAARKVVALTGTVYGGKASSLFHLLFRLSPEMARSYVDQEAVGQRRIRSKDWVSAYGILQSIETVTSDEDGKQTANSRSATRTKELPGGSPAMLPWLLNRSVFLSLGDMGFPLPPYTEIPVSVLMNSEQAVLYETLKEQLKEELKERLVRGDKSLLAGYLYALLFWPDSPRRGKRVTCPRTGEVVASIPGLPDTFVGPKEREIIRLCQQEKAQGRRVLLLCGQTDTLDIQPEWREMLAEAGLKAAILRAAPNKREKWVEQQVQAGVDVLITHPRKVETGLDLLDFPTIVWMAVDYSVYTVLQASRRSWRIGQTEPVKVYFYAYESTLQEDALRLVAAKVAAALRVNGDTIADDSLAELDELSGGDIVTTLARIVTGEVQVSAQSLQQAFAEANVQMQQANQLIGQYQIVEPTPLMLPDTIPHPTGNGNGHFIPPGPANGKGKRQHQPSLFTPYVVPTNGAAANGVDQIVTNLVEGNLTQQRPDHEVDKQGSSGLPVNGHSPEPTLADGEPPHPGPTSLPPFGVPRPQLLTRLLARS